MRFLRSRLGAAGGLVLLTLGLALVLAAVRVDGTTRAARVGASAALDFDAMRVPARDVEFDAVDGIHLRGWLLRGSEGQRAIALCHDFGQDKASLINLAIALQGQGFTVLLFDFRGHGQSAGNRSTLGLNEKRDVLGAVDFLVEQPGVDRRQVGVFGVGMGAHAAVLAAADRRSIRVLVLDGLYPDAGYALARGVFGGWAWGKSWLAWVPRGMFTLLVGSPPARERAADVLHELVGRDVLLLAPAGDAQLADSIREMYGRIPEQVDVDGNLVFLPGTQAQSLYGEDLDRHVRRVAAFFLARLPG